MAHNAAKPVIVAGVDGSAQSKEALRWAAQQAALIGAELHAVTAWHLPEIYGYSDRDYAADAANMLEKAVSDTLGPDPGIPVVTQVVEGHPAQVLIAMCQAADLLVVGSHGHGWFDGMLLGSVSQHCVQHACCPVLVVRPRASRGGGRPGGL